MIKYIQLPLSLILLCLVASCQDPKLTLLPDEQFVELINTNKLPDPSEIIRIDQYGNEISQDSLINLYRIIDIKETAYINSEGEIKEIHFNPKRALNMLAIDCNKLDHLLDSIKQVDQSIRERFNPHIDYENLEFVVSVVEQCGLPEKRNQLNTVFLVLQHNHSNYQKKYIDQLKEQAKQGNIDRASLALMDDRILVNDGKPQIYGTQLRIKQGSSEQELIELFDPQNVNKRREEVGLEPLEDYLKSFGIEYKIKEESPE